MLKSNVYLGELVETNSRSEYIFGLITFFPMHNLTMIFVFARASIELYESMTNHTKRVWLAV